MRTRADLQRRVIAILGEAFPQEIATADDIATIDGYIDSVVAGLARRRVVYLTPGVDQIDDEVFPHLAVLVANDARAEYRQPRDENAERRAEARLREMQIEPDPGETVQALYF